MLRVEDCLFVIPARGGSKGIPDKNIKLLDGKPLIQYTVDFARFFVDDANICVSTDDSRIVECLASFNYQVPFIRPSELATDSAGTFAVLKHAVSFYQSKGRSFSAVVLLQPTSPFRKKEHFLEGLSLFDRNLDMVVSVTEAKGNPYFTLFEENERGYLGICKGDGKILRRQDAPVVYEYNGSIYIISYQSLIENASFANFTKIRKLLMSKKYSIDLDTPEDWNYAEWLAPRILNEY